jgi:uncharacterized protein YecE (DUF72 family)
MMEPGMQLYCGTSGFSFKAWKGPFYPDDLPASEMLSFYAARLKTVEINNTFYRLPRKNVVRAWRDQVPESFRFAIKASRRISHSKRLVDCKEPASLLFGAVAELGDRLGAVLVQLPPNLRADVERLHSFLGLVPESISVAFEFRHESWQDETVFAALREHDAAWVTADDKGDLPDEIPTTASWTYLRLRAPEYKPATLRNWRARCGHFERAFVYFKHEDDALGTRLAARMQALKAPSK